jgi:hypothetical protein
LGERLEEYCVKNGVAMGWTYLMSLNQATYQEEAFAFAKAMMGKTQD